MPKLITTESKIQPKYDQPKHKGYLTLEEWVYILQQGLITDPKTNDFARKFNQKVFSPTLRQNSSLDRFYNDLQSKLNHPSSWDEILIDLDQPWQRVARTVSVLGEKQSDNLSVFLAQEWFSNSIDAIREMKGKPSIGIFGQGASVIYGLLKNSKPGSICVTKSTETDLKTNKTKTHFLALIRVNDLGENTSNIIVSQNLNQIQYFLQEAGVKNFDDLLQTDKKGTVQVFISKGQPIDQESFKQGVQAHRFCQDAHINLNTTKDRSCFINQLSQADLPEIRADITENMFRIVGPTEFYPPQMMLGSTKTRESVKNTSQLITTFEIITKRSENNENTPQLIFTLKNVILTEIPLILSDINQDSLPDGDLKIDVPEEIIYISESRSGFAPANTDSSLGKQNFAKVIIENLQNIIERSTSINQDIQNLKIINALLVWCDQLKNTSTNPNIIRNTADLIPELRQLALPIMTELEQQGYWIFPNTTRFDCIEVPVNQPVIRVSTHLCHKLTPTNFGQKIEGFDVPVWVVSMKPLSNLNQSLQLATDLALEDRPIDALSNFIPMILTIENGSDKQIWLSQEVWNFYEKLQYEISVETDSKKRLKLQFSKTILEELINASINPSNGYVVMPRPKNLIQKLTPSSENTNPDKISISKQDLIKQLKKEWEKQNKLQILGHREKYLFFTDIEYQYEIKSDLTYCLNFRWHNIYISIEIRPATESECSFKLRDIYYRLGADDEFKFLGQISDRLKLTLSTLHNKMHNNQLSTIYAPLDLSITKNNNPQPPIIEQFLAWYDHLSDYNLKRTNGTYYFPNEKIKVLNKFELLLTNLISNLTDAMVDPYNSLFGGAEDVTHNYDLIHYQKYREQQLVDNLQETKLPTEAFSGPWLVNLDRCEDIYIQNTHNQRFHLNDLTGIVELDICFEQQLSLQNKIREMLKEHPMGYLVDQIDWDLFCPLLRYILLTNNPCNLEIDSNPSIKNEIENEFILLLDSLGQPSKQVDPVLEKWCQFHLETTTQDESRVCLEINYKDISIEFEACKSENNPTEINYTILFRHKARVFRLLNSEDITNDWNALTYLNNSDYTYLVPTVGFLVFLDKYLTALLDRIASNPNNNPNNNGEYYVSQSDTVYSDLNTPLFDFLFDYEDSNPYILRKKAQLSTNQENADSTEKLIKIGDWQSVLDQDIKPVISSLPKVYEFLCQKAGCTEINKTLSRFILNKDIAPVEAIKQISKFFDFFDQTEHISKLEDFATNVLEYTNILKINGFEIFNKEYIITLLIKNLTKNNDLPNLISKYPDYHWDRLLPFVLYAQPRTFSFTTSQLDILSTTVENFNQLNPRHFRLACLAQFIHLGFQEGKPEKVFLVLKNFNKLHLEYPQALNSVLEIIFGVQNNQNNLQFIFKPQNATLETQAYLKLITTEDLKLLDYGDLADLQNVSVLSPKKGQVITLGTVIAWLEDNLTNRSNPSIQSDLFPVATQITAFHPKTQKELFQKAKNIDTLLVRSASSQAMDPIDTSTREASQNGWDANSKVQKYTAFKTRPDGIPSQYTQYLPPQERDLLVQIFQDDGFGMDPFTLLQFLIPHFGSKTKGGYGGEFGSGASAILLPFSNSIVSIISKTTDSQNAFELVLKTGDMSIGQKQTSPVQFLSLNKLDTTNTAELFPSNHGTVFRFIQPQGESQLPDLKHTQIEASITNHAILPLVLRPDLQILSQGKSILDDLSPSQIPKVVDIPESNRRVEVDGKSMTLSVVQHPSHTSCPTTIELSIRGITSFSVPIPKLILAELAKLGRVSIVFGSPQQRNDNTIGLTTRDRNQINTKSLRIMYHIALQEIVRLLAKNYLKKRQSIIKNTPFGLSPDAFTVYGYPHTANSVAFLDFLNLDSDTQLDYDTFNSLDWLGVLWYLPVLLDSGDTISLVEIAKQRSAESQNQIQDLKLSQLINQTSLWQLATLQIGARMSQNSPHQSQKLPMTQTEIEENLDYRRISRITEIIYADFITHLQPLTKQLDISLPKTKYYSDGDSNTLACYSPYLNEIYIHLPIFCKRIKDLGDTSKIIVSEMTYTLRHELTHWLEEYIRQNIYHDSNHNVSFDPNKHGKLFDQLQNLINTLVIEGIINI